MQWVGIRRGSLSVKIPLQSPCCQFYVSKHIMVIHGSLGWPESIRQTAYRDRFSCFCRADVQHTDRPHYVCNNRPRLMLCIAMWLNNSGSSSSNTLPLTLLVGRQESTADIWLVKIEWRGVGVVICLEWCRLFAYGPAEATAINTSNTIRTQTSAAKR